MHFPLPLISSRFLFMCFCCLWFCFVSPSRIFYCYDFVLFSFSCVSCCCGFVRFHLTLLSAESEFILIPLYKGIMGFLPYIGLGLLTHFAFFSLQLFNTLGWVCWPFCFLFSSFIHFIGLGLLTLLLSFLFVYSTGPHLLGSILFLYLWVFLIPIFLFENGLLLLISQKGPVGLLCLYFLFSTLLFQEGLLLLHSQKGLVGLPLGFILKILFFFRSSLGPYLCILFSLGLWNIARLLSLCSYSNPSLRAFLGFSPHRLFDANLQKWVSTITNNKNILYTIYPYSV